MTVQEYLAKPLIAGLLAQLRRAVKGGQGDVGALAGAIEREFLDEQREARQELHDFLDDVRYPAAGGPGRVRSVHAQAERRG